MKSTKKNPKLNVKLLRRIQKHILEEPKRLQMRYLFLRQRNSRTFCADVSGQPFAPCGTAACIAGWAMLLSGIRPYDIDAGTDNQNDAAIAERLLGLPEDFWPRLFVESSWPKPFRAGYRTAKSPKQRAKVAAARIDCLIKTGK